MAMIIVAKTILLACIFPLQTPYAKVFLNNFPYLNSQDFQLRLQIFSAQTNEYVQNVQDLFSIRGLFDKTFMLIATNKPWERAELKNRVLLLTIQFSIIISLALMLCASPPPAKGEYSKVWYVHDVITPSLDEIKWLEEGAIAEPPAWIADGSFYQAHMRQSLVNSNDIFVSTYEEFNWPLVAPIAEHYYGTHFNSFQEFKNAVTNNPNLWLDASWQLNTEWYGVNHNTTKISASLNQTTQVAQLWTWFHITRVPEYVMGEGTLENWLTGFDLTPVSTGSLKLWEFYRDFNKNGTTYSLLFKAPANVLSQHGDNFTFNIGVSSYYHGYSFKTQQVIDVNMPATTEIQTAKPADLSLKKGNTATFLLFTGDTYPAQFSATSGPSTKSLSQVALENVNLWFFAPGGWAAIGSLVVLSFTGLRGRKIWQRNKLYHHIYKSMVTIYDISSKDTSKFNQEMDNISTSIFKMLVEDKITDEQFEKLLKRRDDLTERANIKQPPYPPKTN